MGPLKKLRIVVVLLLSSAICTVSSARTIFDFKNFSLGGYGSLSFLGDSYMSSIGTLEISPDTTANLDMYRKNKSGRVMYNKPLQLWEENTNTSPGWVASFKTLFRIKIYPIPGTIPGEGFAFVIAPDLNIPANSEGQYLGLTNSTTDGNATNHLIAVELDTVKQDFDPDNNHIGLNINSIRSKVNVSLSNFKITIPQNNTLVFHTVEVQYDGESKELNVYMDTQLVLNSNINIRDYVNKWSYFGFAASTGESSQLNAVQNWKLELENYPDNHDPLAWIKITVGVGAPTLVLVLCVTVVYFLRKRRNQDDPIILGVLKRLPGTPKEFRFHDLKIATSNFDEKLKLGQGGFGVVFKGVLPKENIEVAVKKFSRESMKGTHDFLAELSIINRLRHKHLVRLLGWCYKNRMLLLVYEYMPNGSLDHHLYGSPEKTLSWETRYKVIVGVATALHYLHNEYDQKVVHRDLKASNIMLDSELNARLGDFGLARALENGKTSYAELGGAPGTRGYIAPECILSGKATRDSDMYGFGAVVLEVICGRRPWTKIGGFQLLVDWVWSLHREARILDAVDERLGVNYVVEEAERLLLLGLACSHPLAKDRPKAEVILQILSGSMPIPYIPLFKPSFIWPTVDSTDDETLTTTADHALNISQSYAVEITPPSPRS